MGTTGPPGAEEAGGCPSVLGGGGVPRRVLSCPGLVAGPSRHEEARTAGSNLTKAQDGVPEFFFFFFPSFSMDGQFDQKGKLSPSPSWMVLGGGGGFFSLPPHSGRSGCGGGVARRQSGVSKTRTKTHS